MIAQAEVLGSGQVTYKGSARGEYYVKIQQNQHHKDKRPGVVGNIKDSRFFITWRHPSIEGARAEAEEVAKRMDWRLKWL